MSSSRKTTSWRPESLDVIQTMYLLTGARPSRIADRDAPHVETRTRIAFEQALAETDFEKAERIILRMALRTHALVWCHNASRRLGHHRRRATVMIPGCRL